LDGWEQIFLYRWRYFLLLWVEQEIRKIGATEIMLRLAKGKDGPMVTENIIWFWMFVSGTSVPHRKKITGVVESGGISARSGSYWVRVGGNKLFWDDYVQ
jgi:hypothetical protein